MTRPCPDCGGSGRSEDIPTSSYGPGYASKTCECQPRDGERTGPSMDELDGRVAKEREWQRGFDEYRKQHPGPVPEEQPAKKPWYSKEMLSDNKWVIAYFAVIAAYATRQIFGDLL